MNQPQEDPPNTSRNTTHVPSRPSRVVVAVATAAITAGLAGLGGFALKRSFDKTLEENEASTQRLRNELDQTSQNMTTDLTEAHKAICVWALPDKMTREQPRLVGFEFTKVTAVARDQDRHTLSCSATIAKGRKRGQVVTYAVPLNFPENILACGCLVADPIRP